MKSPIVLAVVLCLFGFAAAAQQKKPRAAKPSRQLATKTSAPVAEIDTAGLKGLIQTKQRPLLVNFWATWCNPCRDEFPDLVKINGDYGPKGLDFFIVSLDDIKDIKTEVPKFLGQMKATMPSYLLNVSDPEPAINIMDPKWSGDLPATFLYNANGELVYKHFGRVDTADLRGAIEKLVSSKQ